MYTDVYLSADGVGKKSATAILVIPNQIFKMSVDNRTRSFGVSSAAMFDSCWWSGCRPDEKTNSKTISRRRFDLPRFLYCVNFWDTSQTGVRESTDWSGY